MIYPMSRNGDEIVISGMRTHSFIFQLESAPSPVPASGVVPNITPLAAAATEDKTPKDVRFCCLSIAIVCSVLIVFQFY